MQILSSSILSILFLIYPFLAEARDENNTYKDPVYQASLDYHAKPIPGKIEVVPTKPLNTQRDISLAYTPGVAKVCEEIKNDKEKARLYTDKGNLVAVITNGTAVLGLGNIGALAAKPVMEGKVVLFKKFASLDAFDLEINETDSKKLIQVITALEPTFGGINLEDIKAPECFYIEETLKKRLSIPVMHDDQHGTAIVVSAAILNGLKLVGKKISKVKMVVSGAGAAGIASLKLLLSLGLKKENIILLDSKGVVYEGRQDLNLYKAAFAVNTPLRTLKDVMKNADIFLGVSTGKIITSEMINSMAEKPIILALANPEPEIRPELVYSVRKDAIVATGRSDYPNQVNNVLAYPYIFRGALDVGATTINTEMMLAAVKALASLAEKKIPKEVSQIYQGQKFNFGANYILPKPLDPRLLNEIASAVAKAAMESGVAKYPIKDWDSYKKQLSKLSRENRAPD